MLPAILFEPNGYLPAKDGKIMGRQSAGDGFLRAAVSARRGRPLVGYTPHRASWLAFQARVAEIDPTAETRWLPANRLEALADFGVLYRPDANIAVSAAPRLRVGPAAYSICGVTHTLCTAGSMAQFGLLTVDAVMPWDAVVCTSAVAAQVISDELAERAAYLAWRFGQPVQAPRPQLPVIPLGVHAADFAIADGDRAAARAALGLAEDETAALFAGRLSFNGKAHPYPMYAGLEAVAQRTGARIALIHAGQFASRAIEEAFHQATAAICPSVRCLFVDGRDAAAYARGWAAADLFVSLADSIQETFGITPIEAMASGLPVVVSDWDGYKDTVRDGVDGFRIATWQAGPGAGEAAARGYETSGDYEAYLLRTSLAVALDHVQLVDRLAALVTDPDLRRRMGAAAQAQARAVFDWAVVFAQYEALWDELAAIRARDGALAEGAPRAMPGARDPFTAFASFATQPVTPGTRVSPTPQASAARYAELIAQPLLRGMAAPEAVVASLLQAAQPGATVAALAEATGLSVAVVMELASRLAKLDLLRLDWPAESG